MEIHSQSSHPDGLCVLNILEAGGWQGYSDVLGKNDKGNIRRRNISVCKKNKSIGKKVISES